MKKLKTQLWLAKSTIRILTSDRLDLAVGGLQIRTNTWPECGPCWPDPPLVHRGMP